MRLPLLLVLLVVAGCASSSTGAGDSALRSQTVRLGTPISSASAVGGRDFVLRAFAQCPAAPCEAEGYRLAFSNVGQQALNSTFTVVSFAVDGVDYTFDSGRPGFMVLPNTYGEFLGVSMPAAIFATIAEAENVRVQLGPAEYLLTSGDRRTFRDLLARTGGAAE